MAQGPVLPVTHLILPWSVRRVSRKSSPPTSRDTPHDKSPHTRSESLGCVFPRPGRVIPHSSSPLTPRHPSLLVTPRWWWDPDFPVPSLPRFWVVLDPGTLRVGLPFVLPSSGATKPSSRRTHVPSVTPPAPTSTHPFFIGRVDRDISVKLIQTHCRGVIPPDTGTTKENR